MSEIESRKVIAGNDMSKLVGKVLTIFDAAYGTSYTGSTTITATGGGGFAQYQVPTKEEAIKNLITSAIWEWYNSVPPEPGQKAGSIA